jgi:hypothetical protein
MYICVLEMFNVLHLSFDKKQKVKEKCRLANAARVQRTTPTYSISTAAQRITPYALEIAHGQCKWQEKQYHIIRLCPLSYVMIRKKYVPTLSIVSRFCIPREVKVHPTGHFTCSCLFWERHGIPCRHLYMKFSRKFPLRTSTFGGGLPMQQCMVRRNTTHFQSVSTRFVPHLARDL